LRNFASLFRSGRFVPFLHKVASGYDAARIFDGNLIAVFMPRKPVFCGDF
jgi:hypothetical protein